MEAGFQAILRGRFKMYATMRKRYWWKGMCGEVERYCMSCMECVSRKGSGRGVRPPLKPILTGRGVDVLQLPLTESGNKYMVVFGDYLTKWVDRSLCCTKTVSYHYCSTVG